MELSCSLACSSPVTKVSTRAWQRLSSAITLHSMTEPGGSA